MELGKKWEHLEACSLWEIPRRSEKIWSPPILMGLEKENSLKPSKQVNMYHDLPIKLREGQLVLSGPGCLQVPPKSLGKHLAQRSRCPRIEP